MTTMRTLAGAAEQRSTEVQVALRLGVVTSVDVARARLGSALTPGHLAVGVVQGSGRGGEKRRAESRRVAISPWIPCGGCERCRAGLSNHCASQVVLGLHGRDGVLQPTFAVPGSSLYDVPDKVSDDGAALAAPIAAALHLAQMIRFEGKPYITVLGDGLEGLLCAQVLSKLNASVRVLGKHEERMRWCERWGIKHRHVAEPGRRRDQDIVVDATGRGDGVRTALGFVRPRGTVLVLSPPGGGMARDAGDLSGAWHDEITLMGSRGGSLAEALAKLERGEVDVTGLLSRRVRLADVPSVLSAPMSHEHVAIAVEP